MSRDYFKQSEDEIDLLEEQGLLSPRRAAELRLRLSVQRHMHDRQDLGPDILWPWILIPVLCLVAVNTVIAVLVVRIWG